MLYLDKYHYSILELDACKGNSKLKVNFVDASFVSMLLAIFNCSRKEQPRKIYSFKEIYRSIFFIKFIFFLVTFLISPLVVSVGQAAYNTRRYMLAALSLGGEIAYHLFTIDFKKCKNNYDINLMKKSE